LNFLVGALGAFNEAGIEHFSGILDAGAVSVFAQDEGRDG
jgi:hypothetical protein